MKTVEELLEELKEALAKEGKGRYKKIIMEVEYIEYIYEETKSK